MTQNKNAFTLLELIVVIIIIGVLGTLGFSQYTKAIEKSRGSEAYIILGSIKKIAAAYYMEYGNLSGLTGDYCGINSSIPGNIPGDPTHGMLTPREYCMPTHYFAYQISMLTTGPQLVATASRCNTVTSNTRGKPPDVDGNTQKWTVILNVNFANGTDTCLPGGSNVSTNPY